jgi:hypothetical protein
MKFKSKKLNNNSLHLKLIKRSDCNKNYPEYTQHTILEPIDSETVELTGMVGNVSIEVYKQAFEIAKQNGFKYVKVIRIKNDKPIEKIYTVG